MGNLRSGLTPVLQIQKRVLASPRIPKSQHFRTATTDAQPTQFPVQAMFRMAHLRDIGLGGELMGRQAALVGLSKLATT